MSLINVTEAAKRAGLTSGTAISYIHQMSIVPISSKPKGCSWVNLYSSKLVAILKDKDKRVKAKKKGHDERLP